MDLSSESDEYESSHEGLDDDDDDDYRDSQDWAVTNHGSPKYDDAYRGVDGMLLDQSDTARASVISAPPLSQNHSRRRGEVTKEFSFERVQSSKEVNLNNQVPYPTPTST